MRYICVKRKNEWHYSVAVGITGNWDAAKLDLSSNKDSVNNENASLNKPEVPKLNMEPQSMKRKKKGGYNLRKSLAWNKAFFTEEGDPLFDFVMFYCT